MASEDGARVKWWLPWNSGACSSSLAARRAIFRYFGSAPTQCNQCDRDWSLVLAGQASSEQPETTEIAITVDWRSCFTCFPSDSRIKACKISRSRSRKSQWWWITVVSGKAGWWVLFHRPYRSVVRRQPDTPFTTLMGKGFQLSLCQPLPETDPCALCSVCYSNWQGYNAYHVLLCWEMRRFVSCLAVTELFTSILLNGSKKQSHTQRNAYNCW